MAALTDTIGWLTVQEAIDLWPDAPGEEADGYAELASLLGTAWEVLAPKGRPVADGEAVPERYRQAQLLYTRHLWARSKAGDGSTIGPDGYQISTYPLVMEAYTLMRVGRTRKGIRGLR